MLNNKIGEYGFFIIFIVTLVCFEFWVSRTEGSETMKVLGENSEALIQEQSTTKDKDLILGEKIFRSKHLKEARKAFENVISLDSKNAKAHYFLGLIDYEEDDIGKAKTRFQIAHDCLEPLTEAKSLKIETKQAQLQFPNDYEARIYSKDGWYIKPKNPSDIDKFIVSLDAGSSYEVEIKPDHKLPWLSKLIIGSTILASFILVR